MGTFKEKKINKNGVVSIVGANWKVWLNYLRTAGWEWKYLGKILLVTLVVAVGTPFRWWERLRLGRRLRETEIHPSPVFVIGHWRGGTTLLHNILSLDKRFGYVTYLQGLFPHAFMASGFFRWFATRIMPSTRPMDNMKINTESPQEEELALISQSGHSLYNMWVSPKGHMDFWSKYARFDTSHSQREWDKGYTALLRAATLNHGGKRLLLKNPPNTMRIPYLLEKFPDAKFIFIHRNPYKVYASTYRLYRDVINFFQLHDEDEAEVDKNILAIYKEMNSAYLRDKSLIPKGNLVEVKFDDFVADKLGGLRRIYEDLSLGGFEEARPVYEEYLASIKGYKKNKLNVDEEVRQKVNEHWAEFFEVFGYEMRSLRSL